MATFKTGASDGGSDDVVLPGAAVTAVLHGAAISLQAATRGASSRWTHEAGQRASGACAAMHSLEEMSLTAGSGLCGGACAAMHSLEEMSLTCGESVRRRSIRAAREEMPPSVVFPELYYPEESGCCRGLRLRSWRSQGELEGEAVLFVSEDNPGAASVARELQQAMPAKLRLVHSNDAGAEQLQECTHFLLVLNRRTFVTDTDPTRPGERLAKQLREAFRVNSHLNTWNYRFAVGTAVRHTKHGVGKVVELMVDGRTRVLFDNGKEHRYKPSSVHKLTLADPRAKLRAMQRVALSAGALVQNGALRSMSKMHGSMADMSAALGDFADQVSQSVSQTVSQSESTPPKASPPKSTPPKSRLSGRSASDPVGVVGALAAADIERGKEPGDRSPPSRARPQSQGVVDTRPLTFSRFPASMKLVVVHAINDAEDGCEFEHFFTTAPPDLVQAGLFSTIASPLFFYSPDFRKVSISLILESFARKSSGIKSSGLKSSKSSGSL